MYESEVELNDFKNDQTYLFLVKHWCRKLQTRDIFYTIFYLLCFTIFRLLMVSCRLFFHETMAVSN